MEINLDKKSSTQASIKIRLNKSDYQQQVEKKVAEYAKKMNLKGFRPGKVPPGIIRKMYGKSILVEEVNHILSHKLTDYIRENDLKILGEPLPDRESTSKIDWDNQEDFEFDYNIGLVDDFTLDLSKKQKVKKYSIEVDEKAMESTMSDILTRFGKDIEVEASEEGDELEVDVISEDGSVDRKEAVLPLKGIQKKAIKKFVGLKKGDSHSFDAQKALNDEFVIASLTGLSNEDSKELKSKLSITVNGIKRRVDAEINQELFDQVFGPGVVDSEDSFNTKVKETIGENYNREADNHFNFAIRKQLLDKTAIELPDDFLKEWLSVTNENITPEDLEREYDGYAEGLKWSLILNRIATDNKIEVQHDDIRERAKEMIIQQFGGQSALGNLEDKIDPIVDNYLQGENGKHYNEIGDSLRTDKILDVIKESISITEKKDKLDEFTKLVEKELG